VNILSGHSVQLVGFRPTGVINQLISFNMVNLLVAGLLAVASGPRCFTAIGPPEKYARLFRPRCLAVLQVAPLRVLPPAPHINGTSNHGCL